MCCVSTVIDCLSSTSDTNTQGAEKYIVFYKYLVINQYRIFISQQSADKVIKGSKLADFYFFDNIMPSASCNSNIIALQRQFPNILRKDAEGDA